MLPQDLHIHTTFSLIDKAIVPEQTIKMIAFARHARVVGISDHFEMFVPGHYKEYCNEVRKHHLYLGTEVNGHINAEQAVNYDFDYYVYHCWGNEPEDYEGLKWLQATGKPVIVAHPYILGTDLTKIAENSIVEINNRYIWRVDWQKELTPFLNKFRWVFSSDAHQPNWLNHTIARRVGQELGITETVLFPENVLIGDTCADSMQLI